MADLPGRRPTAFVSHPDCARHDTGWKHADHQGRLPALVRAVYRDMLTLHDHLVEVEAVPATEADLLRVHTPAHVRAVREAAAGAATVGHPLTFAGEAMVSGASWEAALAAVGCALTGVERVLDGTALNAFCAARPPGYAAAEGAAGGFSLFNSVAIAARYLREQRSVSRVLVVEWGGVAPSAIGPLLEVDRGVRVVAVRAADPGAAGHGVTLPPGSDGTLFAAAFEAALTEALQGFAPEMMLLAAGFDVLAADPIAKLALEPVDVFALTRHLRSCADELCGGRLVSVLEGGYDAAATGAAVVQHLRALAGLNAA